MSHATHSSVRIAGPLIVVWIGVYWARTPGGDAAPLEVASAPLPAARAADPGFSGLLPHERERAEREADPSFELDLEPSPAGDPEPRSPVPTDRTYAVQDGDTLGDIAIREYGSIVFADFIFQANRDQLASPHDLDLGMVLRLPPKP